MPWAISSGQRKQCLQGGVIQQLGVINQQIDLLPGQRKLRYLSQDRTQVRLSNAQTLSNLPQYRRRIDATAARRNNHTLHGLLVGTGHQSLAQQGLTTAPWTRDSQQQLAVTRQMVQLPQNRLALCREKLEARHARSKRIVTELIVAEESLIGMQVGHQTAIS